MRGGHGKAGRKKHKWTWVIKYEPDYFGKHGFKRAWVPTSETLNVGELDEQVNMLLTRGLAKKVEDGVAIDLSELGVDKLLGSGKVTQPLIVTTTAWSETAAQKIEHAGGRVLSTIEDEVEDEDTPE
jgi:large subunit ribosomal protein L15